MMGSGFGEQVSADFFKGLIVAVFLSFLMGVAACWLVPKAWHLVKPVIHRLTA